MNLFRISLFLFAIVLAGTTGVSQDSKADPREKIETAVPEAIRLLEAKEYGAFLKAFVSPEDLKQFSGRGKFEAFQKEFGSDKAPSLLAMLKAIKDEKPTMEAEGKKAIFKFKEPMDGKKSISFFKVDKYWYLQNHE